MSFLVFLFAALSGAAALEWFVDSVTGNDSNDGTTLMTPLQSFGGVASLMNATKPMNLTVNFEGEFSGPASCGVSFVLSSNVGNVTFRPTNASDYVRMRCSMPPNRAGQLLSFVVHAPSTLTIERFDFSDIDWSVDDCGFFSPTAYCEMNFLKISAENGGGLVTLLPRVVLREFRLVNNTIRRMFVPQPLQGG
jgi:hypothetical protein